jgi:hypothetical protein
VLAALKKLTELKGIGPATASLLLSVGKPDEVPFFSDELFRWCVWDEEGSPGGWQRKIKYNVKEYEQLVEGVRALRERLGGKVIAVDVEKVAWVLGREGVDVDVPGDGDEDVGEETAEKAEAEESVTEKVEMKEVKKGTKRKVAKSEAPSEGTRKSTRTKK